YLFFILYFISLLIIDPLVNYGAVLSKLVLNPPNVNQQSARQGHTGLTPLLPAAFSGASLRFSSILPLCKR
ncbi:hypothetical protein, partial [Enterocloster lavalensis]|uniref:hypothetical protein n=1 Tax=Enterocloster lavalensis TaxID=460384 RepID=UPI002FD8A75A